MLNSDDGLFPFSRTSVVDVNSLRVWYQRLIRTTGGRCLLHLPPSNSIDSASILTLAKVIYKLDRFNELSSRVPQSEDLSWREFAFDFIADVG